MTQTREAPILRRRKNDLPHDIVLNILTRLPTKSVIRFRCVCKTWDSSITTPYFISTHLNNFAYDHDNHNGDGDGYIIHMPWDTNSSNRAVCTVALDRTFDRISEIEVPFDLPSGSIQIVGSCNGLLCLARNGGLTTADNVIYLWNPSIRKFKRLPDSCLGRLGGFVNYGFAYHSENNEYKVVRISGSLGMRPPIPDEIEVYTLSSDAWRRVGMSLRANVMIVDNCSLLPLPLVSGALHWISIVIEEEGPKSEVIMSFDVNSEEFRMLGVPDCYLSINRFQTSVALFKRKLAFLTFGQSEQRGGYQFSIWVMREYGVLESWSKLFVVPIERVAICIGFTMYGSLLLCCSKSNNQAGKVVLVDTKNLHAKDSDIQYPSCVATFMESLALLDGANMVSY